MIYYKLNYNEIHLKFAKKIFVIFLHYSQKTFGFEFIKENP